MLAVVFYCCHPCHVQCAGCSPCNDLCPHLPLCTDLELILRIFALLDLGTLPSSFMPLRSSTSCSHPQCNDFIPTTWQRGQVCSGTHEYYIAIGGWM
ncbi:hypothetical protein C8Q70DRAFT_554226 [Cubamyces menziesii]|nr:hypothetical protein C8Q70DRAFT_554226 [Cubamyces menziesii]